MLAKSVHIPDLDQLNVLLLRSLQGPPITEFSLPGGYKEQIDPAPLKGFHHQVWPSVKSIEQEEDGADADHCAEDERVPSLPQVDSLDEIVDGWETIGQRVDPALYGFQEAPLGGHVLLGRHGNTYCVIHQSVRISQMLVLL